MSRNGPLLVEAFLVGMLILHSYRTRKIAFVKKKKSEFNKAPTNKGPASTLYSFTTPFYNYLLVNEGHDLVKLRLSIVFVNFVVKTFLLYVYDSFCCKLSKPR